MNLAKEIIERLEGSGYLSKTLGDEAGKEWRKGRNDYVEAIITEKLSPILRENAAMRVALDAIANYDHANGCPLKGTGCSVAECDCRDDLQSDIAANALAGEELP